MNKPYIGGVPKKEIPEILESAREMAHDLYKCKPFEGYTETEVMKGLAVFSIALTHIVRENIDINTDNGKEQFLDAIDAAGIVDDNDNCERIGEVCRIVINIIRDEKKAVPLND